MLHLQRTILTCLLVHNVFQHTALGTVSANQHVNKAVQSIMDLFRMAISIIKGEEPRVFVSTGTEILVLNATTDEFIVITNGTKHPTVSISFDPVAATLYFATTSTIEKMKLDGTEREVVMSRKVERGIAGMALDLSARNIYWTEEYQGQISVLKMDGSSQKVLISKGLNGPRPIAVDPVDWKIYWAEWRGENPRIARASLDGSNVETLITKEIFWPNGLALDIWKRRLYFGDAYNDNIESFAMDGTDGRIIVNRPDDHFFRLSYLDGTLFWTDWRENALRKVATNDTRNVTTLLKTWRSIMAVHATYLKYAPITNECSRNNGGCSHLCFYVENAVTCACPDESELARSNSTIDCVE